MINQNMNTTKIIKTQWFPDEGLIETHLSGDVGLTVLEQWEQSLNESLEQIPNDSSFKIFINFYGFRAADFNAHKRFRNIIPMTMSKYGWKVGYLNIFEGQTNHIVCSNTRGIQCIAAAHCHQDIAKMELFETKYSSENEHYFIDPQQAIEWLKGINIPKC
ncbi:MAG: hypothetical protein WCR42_03520 [bacterium]